MDSYVIGDVVSFRLTNKFTDEHLDYLNNKKGTKSRLMAKYCINGITLEMEDNIVLCGKDLPIETRDWLNNADNIHLLVSTLRSVKLKDSIFTKPVYEQTKSQDKEEVASKHTQKSSEIRLKDNVGNELNDFLKQLL